MVRRTSGRLRKAKQKLRVRYTRDREDRQLAGLEPVVPAGSVKPERVDPSTQSHQQLPELIRQALREGWDVPDSAKQRCVAELLSGVLDPDTKPRERIRLVKVLLL